MRENMENIRFADFSDKDALINIWTTSFYDDKAYVEFFLQKYLKKDMALCLCVDNTPVSVLYMLPAELVRDESKKCITGNNRQKIRYIYAVATLKEYRGYGYAKSLLKYALEYLRKRGMEAAIVPADEGLSRFYKKYGFENDIYIGCESFAADEVKSENSAKSEDAEYIITCKECNAERYFELRQQYLKNMNLLYNNGYIEFAQEAVKYAVDETVFCGGFCKEFLTVNGVFAFLGYYIEREGITELSVKEFLTENIWSLDMVKKVISEYTHIDNTQRTKKCAEKINIRFPAVYGGAKRAFALCSAKCSDGTYFNLVLD